MDLRLKKFNIFIECINNFNKGVKWYQMELNQIKTFIKVAQLLSFSNAAEELGYSQSAVTIHIQLLEKELGVSLFDRIGRKVYLSESGHVFLNDALMIVNSVEQAKLKVKEPESPSGTLRIGTVESLSTVILPPILLELHQRYPKIKTIISNGTTPQLEKQLKNHEIDLLLTLDYPIYGQEWIKLFEKEEESIFIGSKSWISQLSEEPTLSEIISKPFILTQGGASYRKELELLLASQNLTIIPQLEISNPETILNLLDRGFGFSFLPKFLVTISQNMEGIDWIDYEVPASTIKVQLIKHQNKQMTVTMQTFCDLFIASYEKGIE